MGTMHEIFDGSDPALIDAARAAFEADAAPYDFDLTRHQCAAPEPWSEYADEATGHRWGGWLAAMAAMSIEIAIMRAALELIAKYPRVSGDELGYEGCRKVAREALKTPNVELTGSRAGSSPVSPATEGSEVERRVGGAVSPAPTFEKKGYGNENAA